MKLKRPGAGDQKITVGAVAREFLLKAAQEKHQKSPIELEREMHSDYEWNLHQCVESSKKTYDGDFFAIVITKKEPLMQNVLRNYFFARSSCPTPDYDQAVYHYHRASDHLEFLWVIPSRDTSHLLRENALLVAPEERELLRFVLDFSDGSLALLSKKLNGEKIDSSLLETP